MRQSDQKLFSDANKLVAYIQQIRSPTLVIAIDGWPGAGKTFLAETLARALEIPTFDLDSYVLKNQGEYLERIKFDELKESINNAGDQFILSGVFILDVFAKIELKANLHIYVKQMSKTGFWNHEEYSESADGEDPFQEIDQIAGTSGSLALERAVRDYHLARHPHCDASIIFHRIEIR